MNASRKVIVAARVPRARPADTRDACRHATPQGAEP